LTNWYQLDGSDALKQLASDGRNGLAGPDVAGRLEKYGPNELVETGGRGPLAILWEQVSGSMVVLLIVAALVSVYLEEYKDAAVILTIVVLNAILGFVQDYRAEKALAALKQLAVPTVRVRRDGEVQEISARDLVPGDLLLLEAGNVAPADGRLLEAANLRAQESALTGESEPVAKDAAALSGEDLPLGDRLNMVFMGTQITYGRGQAVITETGMQTELGQIARMLQTVTQEPTPLQRRLAQLGRGLAVAALVIVAVVFAIGLARGESAKLMFLTAMSLAVAAVPEGLPAVATVALALGARRMLKRQTLIRKLPAVETLGSVTVVCSDKTGTLTENRMTVTVVDLVGDRIELSQQLSRGRPILPPGQVPSQLISDRPGLVLLLAGGGLCNDAELKPDNAGNLRALGDPTEGAMVVAAAGFGIDKPDLDRQFRRVAELPFDSVRKRMTTVHEVAEAGSGVLFAVRQLLIDAAGAHPSGFVAFSKGAVDSLLEVCDRVWIDGRIEPLNGRWREKVMAAQDELAGSGMRVLGVAFRLLDSRPSNEMLDGTERELIFVGMIGMIDPPRPEVTQAVERCKTAGIRPIMITGDHPLTAMHIAQKLGISADGAALTGRDLARMSQAELETAVEKVSVYARVSPEHKLQIVRALQDKGHIAAMTGDGVNDAPALKKADIGVAMGITGTDVSKEASEMVLLDDNFATIVSAVEQGRIVYDNIRKFVKYTLTSNAGEVWVMLLAPFLGMPLPLLPLQILWINLVTDGLPGLALAVEAAERNTMRRPPYPPRENIFRRGMGRDILWIGLLMGVLSLGAGYWYWEPTAADDAYWRTIIFTVLTLSQMGNALAIRSSRESLFTIGVLSNKFMVASVSLTFVLQLAVIYVPVFQNLLKTVPLSLADLAICLVLSTIVFWSVELAKWAARQAAR
jgi:Ca2+-transporting ATPase